MERGTDWEREAVRERWAELERQRRNGKRLLGGTVLVFVGLFTAFLSLVPEACVEVRPWPYGCTAVVPQATAAVLLAGGLLAIASGLWVVGTRFSRDRGGGPVTASATPPRHSPVGYTGSSPASPRRVLMYWRKPDSRS